MRIHVKEHGRVMASLVERREWDALGINIDQHPPGQPAEVWINPATMRLLLPLFIAFARTGEMMPGGLPEYRKLRRSYEGIEKAGHSLEKIRGQLFAIGEIAQKRVRDTSNADLSEICNHVEIVEIVHGLIADGGIGVRE